MTALKLSIKAGMDFAEVVQGTAAVKAAIGSIGSEAKAAAAEYKSGARAMIEDSREAAAAAGATGAAVDAVATGAAGTAGGVGKAGRLIEDALTGVSNAAREAAATTEAIKPPAVNDNGTAALTAAITALSNQMTNVVRASVTLTQRTDALGAAMAANANGAAAQAAAVGRLHQVQERAADDGAGRLAAAIEQLEGFLDPAARAVQVMTARTELLNKALTDGVIDGTRHAAIMEQLRQAQQRTADEGAARLAAAVDQLEAQLDPAARAAQVLTAREELLNQALAAGAIDGARHTAVLGQLRLAAEQAANEGVARLAAAADELEAELDPAIRAAQALTARTAMLDKALASGAISAERHAAIMARLKGGYDAVTGAGKLTHQQSVQLGYQLNDVFTSLASGASPFMVLAQQGGQVTQIFGGVRQTLARIPPVAWMAAAAVALIAVPTLIVGNRIAEIGRETRTWGASIAALNPSLGVSTTRLRELTFAIADAKGLDRGAVSGGISAIIASGRVQGEAMVAGLAGVAGDIAAVKGGDLSSWAEKLAEGFGRGAAGVRELDESLRFLTPAQARSIEALERQGDRAGALAVAMGALEGKFGGSAKAMQSEMEDAFGQMGRAWDRFVEAMAKTDFAKMGADMGTGLINGLRKAFAPTDDERLAGFDKRIQEMRDEGPNTWGDFWGVERARWQARLDAMIAERDALAAEIRAKRAPATVPGAVPGGSTPPAVAPGGMTDAEVKNLDRLREALAQETAALAGNAVVRQVRLARMQAENAAYAAGRGKEAAEAEGAIAAQRATLALTVAANDNAAATRLATRGQVDLTNARLQGAEAAMRVEAANAAAAEAATSPIDAQARARQLLADAVARTSAEGAGAVAAAEAEAAAQERLAAAAGGTADVKARAELANKIDLATAPLRVAMALAEGDAKDQLRQVIERLTGAIIDQDAAARQAAQDDTLAEQRRELEGIVALTRVETEMQGRSVRERRLAVEHQQAINEAIRAGIDLSSEFGKQWLANADAIAKAKLDAERNNAAAGAADSFGGMLNALEAGDAIEVGDAIANFSGELDNLLATTENVGEAFDAFGESLLKSAKAGMALGDLVGKIFGRTGEQQKNAEIGGSIGSAAGSFLPGGKAVWAFVGNIVGGMIGGGRAERDAKAQKAAADLDALTGSINSFVAANSNVSQAGAALRSLDQQFADLSAEAKRLGTDTKALENSYSAARARLIANQNSGIYAELATLTGDVTGQFQALRRSQEDYVRAAIEGEADVGAARQVAYLRERQWLSERTVAELDALGAVVSLADKLTAQMRELLGSISTQIDRQLDASRSALSLAQNSAAAFRSAQSEFKSLRSELRQDTSLSTLTPQQKLADALSRYASTRDAAAGGDVGAQREFATASRAYLEAAQAYAGEDTYRQIFNAVDRDLAAAELSAAALAGGAEYQASLLESQVRIMEQIRDNLASTSPDQALLVQQLAALGTINGLLQQSNNLTIGQTTQLTAEQRATASLTRDITSSLDSGLNIVDAPSIAGYLNTLEAGLAGNNSAEAVEMRNAIALLRTVTADGFIDATEAGPTRAALAVLGTNVMGTTTAVNSQTGQVVNLGNLTQEQVNAVLAGNSLQGLGNSLTQTQTGEVISGNSGQDALAALLAQGTELNQDIIDAITGGTSVGVSTIAAITAGNTSIVNAINAWIGLAQQQADAEADEQERQAREAAYNAQVDSASRATRTAANNAMNAANALPDVEAATNQRATSVGVDATSGRELWMKEDRGDDTSRARARGLANSLGGVAKILEGLLGGDIGDIIVEAGNKYGLGYEVGGIRKINQFGINDFTGVMRSFVVDAITAMVGGDEAAKELARQQDYTDVSIGLEAASAAIYRMRNPAPAFAGGGQVRGPGTGTSDDIAAWLSNGEHVIKAGTASRFGHDVLDLVNRGDLRGAVQLAEVKGALPAFKDGGQVGATFTAPALPRVGASQGAVASAGSDERLLRVLTQELQAFVETEEDGQKAQAVRDARLLMVMQQLLEIQRRMDARDARRSGTGT
ncbi:phage tail length tape measure family protein [Niveispirillum sp. KHB5.9]|uniref:phage tail length tape measure family protein n=1 Tax=Niveispirillum sp. KHB5.9 TaxID=3400269 RepID=UPI003A88CF63